jgi:hypothetical protein
MWLIRFMGNLDIFSMRIGTMNLDMQAKRQAVLPLPFRGERAGVRGPSLLGAQSGFVVGRLRLAIGKDVYENTTK